MRKSQFTEEQVAMAPRRAEAGTPVAEVCRKPQISEQMFYRSLDGTISRERREKNGEAGGPPGRPRRGCGRRTG